LLNVKLVVHIVTTGGTCSDHGDLNGINLVPLLLSVSLNFASTLSCVHGCTRLLTCAEMRG